MPAKGSKNCCCNGCYERPVDRALASGELQEQQAYCCACIPKVICITLESATDRTTTSVKRDCTAVEGDPILWSGSTYLDGATIDLAFVFKIEAEACSICVRSTALLVDESSAYACQAIDATQRAAPNWFCWRLWIDESAVTWVIDGITITLSAAIVTAIENRSDCQDEYGNRITDEHPIKNLCGCCGCICECACITVFGDNMQATQELVCLDGGTKWVTSAGVEIGLVANYTTGECELALLSEGYYSLSGVAPWPANVPVGTLVNPCPLPNATFESFTADDDAIFFLFACSPCAECPGVATPCCGNVPRILTATIDGGVDCPCGSLSLTLAYDEDFDTWFGESDTAFCDHQVSLSLACDSEGSWTLTFAADPCIGDSDTQTGSCQPLSISFTINSAGGIGCCGPGDFGGAKTLTITVTE